MCVRGGEGRKRERPTVTNEKRRKRRRSDDNKIRSDKIRIRREE